MIKEKFNLSTDEDKMLKSVYLRTLSLSSTYNYERMQALGYIYAMIPVIKRTCKTEEEKIEVLQRHNEIFNTTPTMGGLITGLSASMEVEAAKNKDFDKKSINAVKVSLMGPFAGIGDSFFQGTLKLITLGIGIGLAKQGNILGVLIHLLMYNIIAHMVRYYGVYIGYGTGGRFMSQASEKGYMGLITKGAGIVGMMTIGAMSVSMISCSIAAVPKLQGSEIQLQALLDSIFPGLLPLVLLFLSYKALKKGVQPIVIMIVYMVIGVLGKVLGIF